MLAASIRDLFDKNVTRGEFLKYIGVILLSVVGFYSILRSVSEAANRNNINSNPKNDKSTARQANYYGGTVYGD